MCIWLFNHFLVLLFVKHANMHESLNFKRCVTPNKQKIKKLYKLTKMYLGKNVCHSNKLKDITRRTLLTKL